MLSTLPALSVSGIDVTDILFSSRVLSHRVGIRQAPFTFIYEADFSSWLWAMCSLGEVEFWKWLISSGVSIAFCCADVRSSPMCLILLTHIPVNVDAL